MLQNFAVFKSKTAKINLRKLVRKILLAMKCTVWYIVNVNGLMHSNRSFKNVIEHSYNEHFTPILFILQDYTSILRNLKSAIGNFQKSHKAVLQISLT